MRILLTGGAGFIGSHLCAMLLEKGHDVICMDNLITGCMDNISHLSKDARFKFINNDVSNYIDVDGPIDCVMHFASPASPVDYLKHPIETLKAGSLGTHNALGVAIKYKSRFLLASTSEVYGDPLVNPQPEEYWGNVNCAGPRGCYDEAKRFAEAMTLAYHRSRGLDTKIVRIFNTYGPRMRDYDGRAIPNFICQSLQGKPVTVYGDGLQTRSFCYVSDLIDGIYRLLCSAINEPVNIGNPNEMTLLDLAREIIKLTGSSSRIEYRPLPVNDPKVRRPDIGKAQAMLGWKPVMELREGLRHTINFFKGGNV
ncbi:MAG: SDR family oxidoreductase [Candidatus Omnitrophica bacterium]|nr:SDR family oxidoreductase [Candidatus Omnitrophota bacterium]